MRVLVTGSRNWPDPEVIYRWLESLRRKNPQITVVHGACSTGADQMADDWVTFSEDPLLHVERHHAHWRDDNGRLDRSAGYRRNAEMVKAGADVCLAFVHENSPGTTHCLRAAQNAGIPTLIVRS